MVENMVVCILLLSLSPWDYYCRNLMTRKIFPGRWSSGDNPGSMSRGVPQKTDTWQRKKRIYSITIAGLNGRAVDALTSSLSRPW
jgi:hypothetical protein